MSIQRRALFEVESRLAEMPAVALLGPRQSGKTTLSLALAEERPSVYLDLESPADRARLAEPELYFADHADELVILDEIQRLPGLFEVLRGVIDAGRRAGRGTGRFLLLGSASIELLQQSGETLAGRIAFVELTPLDALECAAAGHSLDALWVRGGFPESLLAHSDAASMRWRQDFVRTYLERDVPQLGPRVPAETLRRFWTMLAHQQGGLLNAAVLARGLAVDGKTVARYLDLIRLRTRLALTFAAILVAALGTAFIATYRGTGTQVRSQIDQGLGQDASAFEQRIPPDAVKPQVIAKAAQQYLDDQISFGVSPRLYAVPIAGGTMVSNLPELSPSEGSAAIGRDVAGPRRESTAARALQTAKLGYSTVDVNGEPLRLYFIAVERGGHRVAEIGVGEPAAAIARAQSGVARTFLYRRHGDTARGDRARLRGSPRASRARCGGWPRRRPRCAPATSRGGSTRRGPHDEVRVLADAFDRMLDRLEDAFARQRSFVADASHELRTPLTVIRGQLEVLARQTEVTREDVRHVDEVVRTEVVRMERLVEDLLLLARADEGELLRPAPLELRPFVTELFDALTLTAERSFELGDGARRGRCAPTRTGSRRSCATSRATRSSTPARAGSCG